MDWSIDVQLTVRDVLPQAVFSRYVDAVVDEIRSLDWEVSHGYKKSKGYDPWCPEGAFYAYELRGPIVLQGEEPGWSNDAVQDQEEGQASP